MDCRRAGSRDIRDNGWGVMWGAIGGGERKGLRVFTEYTVGLSPDAAYFSCGFQSALTRSLG